MPTYTVSATLEYEREVTFTIEAPDEDTAEAIADDALQAAKLAVSEEEALQVIPGFDGGLFCLNSFDITGVEEE